MSVIANGFPSPSFVLNEASLKSNCVQLQSVAQASGVQILLAFKAFAQWRLFPILKPYISGATASSLNEVRLCNEELGTKAHTYCVAYKPDEFEEIIQGSSHITFNSLSEYERWIDRVPTEVSVGLRVNPEWSDVETDLYNPSDGRSRLGVTSGSLPAHLPNRIDGLHIHVLCESNHEALAQVLLSIERKFGHVLPQIKWVNLGGGHLMTHADYDKEQAVQLLKARKEAWGVDLILEPGSAWVWQTGDLHTTVLDVVSNSGCKTAIMDASFTCHMPDCLEMPYRPEVVGASTSNNGGYPYRIGGVSCLAGDFLDTYYFDNPVEPGQALVFKDMLHYTLVKTTSFNGVAHPALVLNKGSEFQVLRRYDYEDYKKRMS